jgi:hypothetical protein
MNNGLDWIGAWLVLIDFDRGFQKFSKKMRLIGEEGISEENWSRFDGSFWGCGNHHLGERIDFESFFRAKTSWVQEKKVQNWLNF